MGKVTAIRCWHQVSSILMDKILAYHTKRVRV